MWKKLGDLVQVKQFLLSLVGAGHEDTGIEIEESCKYLVKYALVT